MTAVIHRFWVLDVYGIQFLHHFAFHVPVGAIVLRRIKAEKGKEPTFIRLHACGTEYTSKRFK